MERDIRKKLEEYSNYRKKSARGKVYYSDCEQIRKLNTDSNGKVDTFGMIYSALKVGFVIGYHAANNDRVNK